MSAETEMPARCAGRRAAPGDLRERASQHLGRTFGARWVGKRGSRHGVCSIAHSVARWRRQMQTLGTVATEETEEETDMVPKDVGEHRAMTVADLCRAIEEHRVPATIRDGVYEVKRGDLRHLRHRADIGHLWHRLASRHAS
jgi:hypothetical protein